MKEEEDGMELREIAEKWKGREEGNEEVEEECVNAWQQYIADSISEAMAPNGEEEEEDVRQALAEITAHVVTRVGGFTLGSLIGMDEEGVRRHVVASFLGDSSYIGENLLHVMAFEMENFQEFLGAGEMLVRSLQGREEE